MDDKRKSQGSKEELVWPNVIIFCILIVLSVQSSNNGRARPIVGAPEEFRLFMANPKDSSVQHHSACHQATYVPAETPSLKRLLVEDCDKKREILVCSAVCGVGQVHNQSCRLFGLWFSSTKIGFFS